MPPLTRAAKGRLSQADLEAVLGVVRLAYEGLAQREVWAEMLRQVRELFRARDAFLVRAPVDSCATAGSSRRRVAKAMVETQPTRKSQPL